MSDDLPLLGHESSDEAGSVPDLKIDTTQEGSTTRVDTGYLPKFQDDDYNPDDVDIKALEASTQRGSERLKKQEEEYWDTWKKRVHTGLSVAGLVFPGADLLNAGLYALEGDYKSAAMAGAAAIPVIGDTYAASKLAYKAGDTALDVVKAGATGAGKTRSVSTGVKETVKGVKNIPTDIAKGNYLDAVSYTHLTLPTKRIV